MLGALAGVELFDVLDVVFRVSQPGKCAISFDIRQLDALSLKRFQLFQDFFIALLHRKIELLFFGDTLAKPSLPGLEDHASLGDLDQLAGPVAFAEGEKIDEQDVDAENDHG